MKGHKMDVEKGKIMYESPPSQQSIKIKLGLTWKTKLKIGILIIIALIYTIVFVRRIIIQEQKLRNVSEMIKKMKPIIASLYEMDQKLAKEVHDVSKSYNIDMQASLKNV